MTRPRLTIAQLMTLILFVGFGFAALRNANQFWASATYTLAIISILVALLCAFALQGQGSYDLGRICGLRLGLSLDRSTPGSERRQLRRGLYHGQV